MIKIILLTVFLCIILIDMRYKWSDTINLEIYKDCLETRTDCMIEIKNISQISDSRDVRNRVWYDLNYPNHKKNIRYPMKLGKIRCYTYDKKDMPVLSCNYLRHEELSMHYIMIFMIIFIISILVAYHIQ